MAIRAPTDDGRDDLDEGFCDAVKILLACMVAVEEEMTAFYMHIATQTARDLPLNQWPTYAEYRSLAAASKRLGDTADRVKTLIPNACLTRCDMKTYIVQARDISLKVSNDVSSTMRIMNKKAAEYISASEEESNRTHTNSIATSVIADALGEVIKHSMEAAKCIWAAVDLLESVPSSLSIEKLSTTSKTRPHIPWVCCAIIAFLFCVVLFNWNNITGTRRASQLPVLNDVTNNMETVILDMQNVCSLVNKNLHVSSQAQDAILAEFNQRFQIIEKALEGNNERIDNVWEALGPPNAHGTYFTAASTTNTNNCRPCELRDSLLKHLEKMEVDALELKRQVQRSEIRLSSRLTKLERKRGD